MRADLMAYIRSDKLLHEYVREDPRWYRKLSRNPELIDECKRLEIHYHQRAIPQKVAKWNQNVQMASMMLEMFKQMRQS